MNSPDKTIIRYDSRVYKSLEKAKAAEQRFAEVSTIPEYNTIEKYGDGFVITNRFDPRCNDQVTPLTPEYANFNVLAKGEFTMNNNTIKEFTPCFSYDFDTATRLSKEMCGEMFGYVTALPVTPEMVEESPELFKLGEWYRTNKFDPRIVAQNKMENLL